MRCRCCWYIFLNDPWDYFALRSPGESKNPREIHFVSRQVTFCYIEKSKVSWEHIRPSRELLTSCQRRFVVRQELRARLRFNGLTMTRPTSLWLPSLSERYGNSICPKYFKDFLNCTTKTRRALYITVISMSYGIGKNSNLAIDKVNRCNEELHRLLLLATVLFWK